MKDPLTYLIKNIITHTDDLVIDETQNGDQTVFTVHVHPEDMGLVIGKQGRIIRAIRDLLKLIAARNGKFVDVVLAEAK